MTKRQAEILSHVIEEYAEVSHPVGSVTLSKLLNVSSATIRAEMGALERSGYLEQPHTSAGRIPTDKGYRWYVNRLQAEHPADIKRRPVSEQTRVLRKRIEAAGEPDQAIKAAVESLVELTSNAGIGTLGTYIYTGGLEKLFAQPEFSDPQTTQDVAYLLDNLDLWLRETNPRGSVSVFIGQENPIGKTSGCSLIVAKFKSPYSDNSCVGVIGSTRQNYRQMMNLVEQAGLALERTWQ